jgi:uncharacterized protein YbjT (DUF2867 family)
MEISDSRILVAGATGQLGGRLARALSAGGAKVAVAGRDPARLAEISAELGAPAVVLDFSVEGSPAEAVAKGRMVRCMTDSMVELFPITFKVRSTVPFVISFDPGV